MFRSSLRRCAFHRHWQWHHSDHYHRGPSRIVWFMLGAGSATLFTMHKEAHVKAHSRYWSHCIRPPIQVPPNFPDTQNQATNPGSVSHLPDNPRSFPPAYNTHPSWPFTQQQEKEWEEDRERIAALSRQAQEAMSELSESTLDSIIQTVQALKAKLAEHRLERERRERQLEEQLEKQRKNPPRFV